MDILKQMYEKIKSVSDSVVKDVEDVFYDLSDLECFPPKDDSLPEQTKRDYIRELENKVVSYGCDLTVALDDLDSVRKELAMTKNYLVTTSREAEDLRNLAQHLKVQNRETNHKRFAAEKNVGAFDVFMKSRVCDLIEKGINPLNGESKGCYAFVDRHSNILSLSYAARKVLGYNETESIDYHDIVSIDGRAELTNVRIPKTIKELYLKIAEGEKVIVRDVHVSPIIIGQIYAGSIVDFRGLSLLEKTRVAWLESKARGLIGEVHAKFKNHKSDSKTKED